MIGDRIDAAATAMETWRGPHVAHFAEDLNVVLGKMASLKLALSRASSVLGSFPDPAPVSISHYDAVHAAAQVEAPSEPGSAAATPEQLRAYVTVASGQDERFATLAGVVDLDGVTAEVSYPRPLNAAERGAQYEAGIHPDIIDQSTVTQTDPVDDVAALVPLDSPSDDVPGLASRSQSLNEFTAAVADGFEEADQLVLDLLAEHPELAGLLLPGLLDDSIDGAALEAILGQMALVEQDPALWQQLTPLVQQVLISVYPSRVGSLDGLPTLARDQANRIALERTRTNLEDRLADLRAAGGPADQVEDLEGQLAGIATIEARLAGSPGRPPAYLLGFDVEGQHPGGAIIAIGNPDYAQNVATYVPGTGAWLGNVGGDIERADRMAVDAARIDGNDNTSVIMWLGYDSPPDVRSAMSGDWAEEGAESLRSFQDGLAMSNVQGDANYTLVGHSYGSTVIGHAAEDGINADNLVFVGSPGVGVDEVSQLQVDPNRVFAVTADNDAIGSTPDGLHGPDPTSRQFGARVVTSDPGTEYGLHDPLGNPAHSDYWDNGNVARDNMAAIVTGKDDLIEFEPTFRFM